MKPAHLTLTDADAGLVAVAGAAAADPATRRDRLVAAVYIGLAVAVAAFVVTAVLALVLV